MSHLALFGAISHLALFGAISHLALFGATSHTAAGIGLAVVSAMCYSCGLVVEKVALTRLPAVHARRAVAMVRTLVTSPLWLTGFVLLLVGLGLQVLALSVAPINLVQPIFASGIVLLVVLSHIVLDDHLGTAEWIGISIVLVALVCLGLSVHGSVDRAGESASFAAIVLAVVPTAVIALACFAVADRGERTRRSTSWRAPMYGLAAGLLYGVAGIGIKGLSTVVQQHGLVAAVPRAIASGYLYLLVLGAGTGLVLFQTGLQRSPAPVIVPVNNVVSSAYLIALGTILYGEHLPTATGPLALRLIGFTGVVVGLAALALGEDVELAAAAAEGKPVDGRVPDLDPGPSGRPGAGAAGQVGTEPLAAEG
jgi:drug/metabolite transporter (DMT)-like permease